MIGVDTGVFDDLKSVVQSPVALGDAVPLLFDLLLTFKFTFPCRVFCKLPFLGLTALPRRRCQLKRLVALCHQRPVIHAVLKAGAFKRRITVPRPCLAPALQNLDLVPVAVLVVKPSASISRVVSRMWA